MDLMKLALGVQFVEFDFHQLFYVKKEEYPLSAMFESWFDDGVSHCQPLGLHTLTYGQNLTIEEWTSLHEQQEKLNTYTEQYVLVQILHMAPMKMNGCEDSRFVLHELVVVPWDCQEDWTPNRPPLPRYKARRRPEEQFLIVLDRWVSHAVLHASKKSHFGLLFERSMYLRMLESSNELVRQTQDEVDRGMDIKLGRTAQDVTQNYHNFKRARALGRKVYDLVDLAYLSVKRETSEQSLHGTRMLMTSDLAVVRPAALDSETELN